MFEQQQPFANFRRVVASLLTMAITLGPTVVPAFAAPIKPASKHVAATATPIQYIVVIFNENVSFDHYFGTYPNALNPKFENKFTPAAATPAVNGLSGALLTSNPNLNPANGTGATNPFRLDVTQAATNDMDHAYTPEQQAFDAGLMDLFPLYTGTAGPPPGGGGIVNTNGLVMGYFDGNTVTGLWNYAQHFAMSDNSYGTNFGPSTPGLINLVSGQTNGVVAGLNPNPPAPTAGFSVADGNGGITVIGDADPLNDVCSNPTRNQVQLGGQNIGDLLEAAGVSWGGFMGGFDLTVTNPNGSTGCNRSTTSNITGVKEIDYTPHHSLFAYWNTTANPNHTRPASVAEIGTDGPANHQYDTNDFFAAVAAGNQPAVSFLKAPAYQDAHAGYSDPIDEQVFTVGVINFLQQQPTWSNTAVIIMYDDSDGWYDHQMGPIVNQSQTSSDNLSGVGFCGASAPRQAGISAAAAQGRCGYGPRLPLVVISPWAKQNFVDHTVTDQTSVIHFIEDNWLSGQRIGNGSFDTVSNSISQMFNFKKIRSNGTLFLNPLTGLKEKE